MMFEIVIDDVHDVDDGFDIEAGVGGIDKLDVDDGWFSSIQLVLTPGSALGLALTWHETPS